MARYTFRQGPLKIVGGATAISFFLVVYTFWRPTPSSITPNFQQSSCSPQEFSRGYWKHRDPPPKPVEGFGRLNMENETDAIVFSGFEGCASTREVGWHLGADNRYQWWRFPNAHSYEWQPSCDGLRPFDQEGLLRDLVERGGWYLLGDSITENQFFSLSCQLYPHVIASPNYIENPYWSRAWPQHLHLNPESPLVSRMHLPFGFDIHQTPLVSFRRLDLIWDKDELVEIHNSMKSSNTSGPTKLDKDAPLFGEEEVYTISPNEYIAEFLAPLPKANYAMLMTSTAGHWTTTQFPYFRDEDETELGRYGIGGVLTLFREAMRKWAVLVQYSIDKDEGVSIGGVLPRRKKRQVLVRAYIPGHEDCHDQKAPTETVRPYQHNWYNWASIPSFNNIFAELLGQRDYPNIHWLGIDNPAGLRPDAHASSDCLHFMTGAGVIEGWTHYAWHYLTREIPRTA